MRLLFVVQRYGEDVAGGAEQACRQFAVRLAARGHRADVLTSAARSYVDWADAYRPGISDDNGVTVHRLPVEEPRDMRVFGPLQDRVVGGSKPAPLFLQREWMRQQGPRLRGMGEWLQERCGSYDVVVFWTYLYHTTWAGLPVAARLAPTLLHPTAHDEPALHLPLFLPLFHQPTAFGFLTEEEQALVVRLARPRRPSAVIGIGVELDPPSSGVGAFRAGAGLGDRPYLLCVGRIDSHKGTDALYDQFLTYKRRRPGPLALVLLGEPVVPIAPHPDVVVTGFLPDADRRAALRGSLALVHPGYFESFSMVLTEAWAAGRPALVQGRSAVLVGQARRSGGALPYLGYAQLEAGIDWLTAHPDLAARMGRAGRRHVEASYRWDGVLDRYERLLRVTAGLALGRAA